MIDIDGLLFQYPKSAFQLDIEQLSMARGESVAVVGPSGSGKTTLLNLISGISVPERGKIVVDDTDVASLADAQRRNFRIANIGFVFQQFELISYLNLRENIVLPHLINKSLPLNKSVYHRAEALAESMGLGDKLNRRISQLSQGEQQRVAVCRALVTDPPILLADEPTGNLDPRNKRHILDLLFKHCEETNATMLVVTHDMAILDGFDRQIDFADFHREGVA